MSNSPNSFAHNTSMADRINKVDLWPYCVGFINVLSIFKIAVFGLLMNHQDWRLKVLVNDLRHKKDFRTQELALERQTQLWELGKFEPIGTHQEEIAKKFAASKI